MCAYIFYPDTPYSPGSSMMKQYQGGICSRWNLCQIQKYIQRRKVPDGIRRKILCNGLILIPDSLEGRVPLYNTNQFFLNCNLQKTV